MPKYVTNRYTKDAFVDVSECFCFLGPFRWEQHLRAEATIFLCCCKTNAVGTSGATMGRPQRSPLDRRNTVRKSVAHQPKLAKKKYYGRQRRKEGKRGKGERNGERRQQHSRSACGVLGYVQAAKAEKVGKATPYLRVLG